MIVYGIKELDSRTILDLLSKKLSANVRIQKLQDYYDGNHEICYRYYDDPSKPNNKIVVNYCKDITDFLTAYLVGIPVQMDVPEPIADAFLVNDEDAEIQDVVHDLVSCGFGCELFYTDENGDVRYNNIDPQECIVLMDDDIQSDITGFIRVVKRDEHLGGYNVSVYTATTKQEFLADEACGSLVAVSDQEEHYFGDVPVVFYPNGESMQGSYEQVIPMQDALNKVVSDSVNDWESFVDSYLVLEGMQGTTEDDIAEMKRNRVLLTDPDSKAYWLTKQADNARIKTLQDDLRRLILELGNVPDLREVSGWKTGGDELRIKLSKTEIQASRLERIVTKGLLRKVILLSNILSLTDPNATCDDVKPIFTRNFIMGEDTEDAGNSEADC